MDCGGGAVDIISYKVTKTMPMEIREVVKGEGQFISSPNIPPLIVLFILPTSGRAANHADQPSLGALCGAIVVDERFQDLLERKLKFNRDDALERIEDHEISEIMDRHWENGIRKMLTGTAREWTIRYPYSLVNPDIMGGAGGHSTFIVTSEEVEEVFRPIVEQIQALVVSQINSVVKKESKLPKVRLVHPQLASLATSGLSVH